MACDAVNTSGVTGEVPFGVLIIYLSQVLGPNYGSLDTADDVVLLDVRCNISAQDWIELCGHRRTVTYIEDYSGIWR